MKTVDKMTTEQLIDELWAATVSAWLGASLGSIMMLGAVFWRFSMRPWYVLLDYGWAGGKTWACHADCEIFRGEVPPPLPVEANLFPLLIFVAGAVILWFTTRRWRTAKNELVRRRTD